MSIGFLQDIKAWIFYPSLVEFWISKDGHEYVLAGHVKNTFPDNKYGSFTQDYELNIPPTEFRYVTVKANNYGACPDWHLGAGGTTWLFADEIIIK